MSRKATHEKVQMYAIGEAGGQIGEIFKLNQYDVVAYNTAKADLDKLKHITDKRLIGVTEGSGKDRKLSANSFKENEAKIRTALTQDLEKRNCFHIHKYEWRNWKWKCNNTSSRNT
jgi:cell division GTPase FtsZ